MNQHVEQVQEADRAAPRADVAGSRPVSLQVIDQLSTGGAQRLLFALADDAAPEHGFRVLSLRRQRNELAGQLQDQGVAIDYCDIGPLFSPASWWRIFRSIRRFEARVVHLHLTSSIILAAPIAKILGKKVVVTLHNVRRQATGGLRPRLLNVGEWVSLRFFSDARVAVGEKVKTEYEALLPGTSIDLLPNVIPSPVRFTPAEKEAFKKALGIKHEQLVFLSTGRLTTQKDHPTMFRAFAKALSEVPGACLLVVGTGGARPDLERLAEELGIAEQVKFLGQRSDIDLLISISDVFLLSSQWEGLPLALLEAMAQGLPVIATTVGDVPKLLGKGGGRLVPAKSPDAFGVAIVELAQDPALRAELSQQALLAVAPYLDTHEWKLRLAEIYRTVLEK